MGYLYIGHLYLSGASSGVDLRTDTKKATCVKRGWTMCSKFVNYSRLNSQHDWGDQYGHVERKRIFSLIFI